MLSDWTIYDYTIASECFILCVVKVQKYCKDVILFYISFIIIKVPFNKTKTQEGHSNNLYIQSNTK